MQQIPKSYFSQTLLEAISEFILYGLKNPFSSTWIPLDCITMVDIFFSYFPTFVSFASYWLLPIYQLLFSSNENIRRHAFNFFKLHLASLAPNVPTFDPFMIPYYEKKSEHIVHQLNQIIQQNEKMGIQAWSITLVVFAKSIQKSSSSVNAMLTILEKYFDVAKSNVRIYTYRAWSYLIYSFAATKTLLTERRLKLVVVPIQASFNNDKNHVFRITAAKTYATLVFSMAKLGTCVEFNQFFPMVHSLLLNILMDPNDEVKDIGCSILAALVQTKEKGNEIHLVFKKQVIN
ncbi:hypothetical protein HMI56_006591 [Coelomomyces lativittatus]|nr:hypothetical protein HMI56_006591 [Coelomomyces lativittatus]